MAMTGNDNDNDSDNINSINNTNIKYNDKNNNFNYSCYCNYSYNIKNNKGGANLKILYPSVICSDFHPWTCKRLFFFCLLVDKELIFICLKKGGLLEMGGGGLIECLRY